MIPDLYTSLCEYQQKFNNNYYYFPLTDKINYLQENLVKTNQVYFWSQGNSRETGVLWILILYLREKRLPLTLQHIKLGNILTLSMHLSIKISVIAIEGLDAKPPYVEF